VVTGASSGIGRELARLAAKAGYDAVLVARRQERLDALAAELAGTGVTARPVVADLSQTSGVDRVLASLAGAPVDVLINDAGVGGRGAFAVERDLALDLAMLRLDMLALVELTGRLLPGMVERRRGRVLNVSSIAGYLPGREQGVREVVQPGARRRDPRHWGTGEHLVPGPGAHRVRRGRGLPGGRGAQ
jgi:short-subunit dehydrogenase